MNNEPFNRYKVQKKTVKLFGINIHPLGMLEVLNIVNECIISKQSLHVGMLNAAKVVNMKRNPALGEDVASSNLILADGSAVVLASKILHKKLPERVAGIDLMHAILERGDKLGYRVFCLGASEEISQEIERQINKHYPGVIIAGRQNGYFSDDQQEQVAKDIAAANADVLFVAITSPKKEQFISTIKKDVLEQGFQKPITKCSADLASKYKAQAYVRPINFFKLSEGKRELIKREITEKEIENNPDSFSPNVLLRPLYQETILPNIAYIGGGAEVAYWMQLKTAFVQENIPFPILILRNSVLFMDDKQNQKRHALGFTLNDLFLDEHQLQKMFVLNQNDTAVSLKDEMDAVENIYASITAKTTDVGLQNSINSQQQKQLKSFKQLEEKLLRIAKQKNESSLNQISKIKQQLFPDNSLQERYDNFILFYLKNGDNFIEILKENLNPLNPNFVVLNPKIK